MEVNTIIENLIAIGQKNNGLIDYSELQKYNLDDESEDAVEKVLIDNELLIINKDASFKPEEEELVVTPDLPSSIKINDSVKAYISEIIQKPLLTYEEEIKYFKQIEAGKAANQKLDETDENDMSVEEYEDIKKTIAISDLARKKVIDSNLRLVVSIAKRYIGRGLDFLDLIQEGNMGLIKAIDKFDYSLGNKFSTFATYWIRQSVGRSIDDHSRTIRIPVHMNEQINTLYKARVKLSQILMREPTEEELAVEMNTTVDKVKVALKNTQAPVSLETPVGDEAESSLSDFVSDPDAVSPLDFTIRKQLKEELLKLVNSLPEREATIIKLRYGLDGGKDRTLEEVGKQFNITRERVRQIEVKSLKKLSSMSKNRGLNEFMVNH